jgi:hypothetical protein
MSQNAKSKKFDRSAEELVQDLKESVHDAAEGRTTDAKDAIEEHVQRS